MQRVYAEWKEWATKYDMMADAHSGFGLRDLDQ